VELKYLYQLFDYQQQSNPIEDCLARREDKKNWTKYSTQEVLEIVQKTARGLLRLGLQPGEKIAIIATTNRPEWHFIDSACMHTGIIDVPVYPTISPAEYEFIFNHAEIKYVFLSDKMLYKKIIQVKDNLPHLKGIFSFDNIEGVPSWKDILIDIDKDLDAQIKANKSNIKEDDMCTIIYTSGTTGHPKGVMLSHKNIVSNIKDNLKMVTVLPNNVTLSFLPICHVFERTLNYTYIYAGASIYYADGLETISQNIADVRPHFFATVPRLMEKVYESIMKKGKDLKGFQKTVFDASIQLSLNMPLGKEKSLIQLAQLAVFDKLVYSKWRAALGGRIRAIICGSAPLQARLATMFNNGGIKVLEGYGLTETSPVLAVNPLASREVRAGVVGKILESVQIKLASDGEILVKGPNVMLGYYKNEEETQKSFTSDGWFLTGDVGEFTEEGYLKITDRKKELFKTSGGKYVAPAPIENMLKESPFIEQVALVGDGRKFIAALIVPSFENLKPWCKENGITAIKNEDIIQHEAVKKHFMDVVNKYNVNFGKVEQVKMIHLLPREWTVESGELTPTMKLKRKVIKDKYKDIIDQFFD
jgi:long-chain acyl-CoA synthetase